MLGGGVALAHSAIAADHMGDAVAACIAVMDAAALSALTLAAARNFGRARSLYVGDVLGGCGRGTPGRAALPWPRGSPFALRVLRL